MKPSLAETSQVLEHLLLSVFYFFIADKICTVKRQRQLACGLIWKKNTTVKAK